MDFTCPVVNVTIGCMSKMIGDWVHISLETFLKYTFVLCLSNGERPLPERKE